MLLAWIKTIIHPGIPLNEQSNWYTNKSICPFWQTWIINAQMPTNDWKEILENRTGYNSV